MELDPETGETRPIIESENKPVDDIPNISLDKKDRKWKKYIKYKSIKTDFTWEKRIKDITYKSK